ncbi:MAG: tRNA (adenosine(37)-N6)-dimethylallyltransferase MiaA, partial [Actinomycetota bacterium]|nr:tRNA (adenosine(37)-N6)-dimethylallyltransferase MiaA [Actinomycetota bacterium]
MNRPRPDAVLVGATASGKSALALALAERDPAWELVTVDSMQVYRGMDIGTAKPTVAEQAAAPHHLLDVLDPWEEASVAWFQAEARAVLRDIHERGKRALLVGGTGLWVQAVVDDLTIPGQFPAVREELEVDPDTEALHRRLAELDPVAAGRMEPGNRRRIVRALEVTLGSGQPFSSFGPGLDAFPPTPFTLVGVAREADDLSARIEARYATQLADGLLAEVERLVAHPNGLSRTAAQALGYKELLGHLDGDCTLGEAVALAIQR